MATLEDMQELWNITDIKLHWLNSYLWFAANVTFTTLVGTKNTSGPSASH